MQPIILFCSSQVFPVAAAVTLYRTPYYLDYPSGGAQLQRLPSIRGPTTPSSIAIDFLNIYTWITRCHRFHTNSPKRCTDREHSRKRTCGLVVTRSPDTWYEVQFTATLSHQKILLERRAHFNFRRNRYAFTKKRAWVYVSCKNTVQVKRYPPSRPELDRV